MRLIDADVLEKYTNCIDEAIEAAAKEIISNEAMRGIAIKIAKNLREAAITDINEQSTIDAEPVVHAHWIETGNYETTAYGSNYFFNCSNCGAEAEAEGYIMEYQYCPYCGAKMDEELNNQEEKQ